MTDSMAPDKVSEAFLAAPPLIAQQILDLTIQNPNFLRDLYETEEWPRGAGTIMEQLIFRGEMPQIERGFETWRKISNLSGCNPCEGPDGSYNWEMMGGHGFERKVTQLMEKDFRSPSYNVNEIQTTANFKQVYAKVVENLYRQVDFYKEINIGQNFLTMLAKKYVIDAGGAQPNTQNPYVYRPSGGVALSTLNMGMLEFFYEQLRRMPDAVAYDFVDGAPIFTALASQQLFSRLYRDDANIRQDVRFSGFATDLLTKYNFQSTLRGMFIAAPILYPRRCVINQVTGEFEEVLPFVRNVPSEVGSHSYLNPAYEAAGYEEMLLHGKFPFKCFYMPTETTLGEGTSFGPEQAFMNSWQWSNPETISDPGRRVGFFWTSAKIGLAQQFSEGIFGVLLARPKASTMAMYTPEPICFPQPVVCTNNVPAVGCPCPIVTQLQVNPLNPLQYFVTFGAPLSGVIGHAVHFQLDSGGSVTGEIVSLSADHMVVEVSFATGLQQGICTHIIGVLCDSTCKCSAIVQMASDCRSGETGFVDLLLSNCIKAGAAENILAYFGDCTTALLTVSAVDPSGLGYVVSYATGYGPTDDPTGAGMASPALSADMICDRKGIVKVCVPPATDASCPTCPAADGVQGFTACVPPERGPIG